RPARSPARRPARSICNSAANRIRNPFKQCPGRQNEALFNSLLEADQHARLVSTVFDALATSESPNALAENWNRVSAHFDRLLDRPEAVDALEQTILHLAVRGLLVPQDASDESADELLHRISVEKDRLIAEGKIKRDKMLPTIDESATSFYLPNGWAWTRLAQLGEKFDYGTSQKTGDGAGVPVLRMGNIQRGQVVFDSMKYLHDQLGELPDLYLREGDLLFNRTNSYELVGKTGLFSAESNRFSFASYLIRVRLIPNLTNPRYVNLYMNSIVCRRTQIEPQIVQQNGQANFNGSKLKHICVPLPPLAEQARIVARVEELRALCDGLRKRLVDQQICQSRFATAMVQQAALAESREYESDALALV
ncbi:restriction endonuclease subunit S, partial [Burkholderia pseudomallei]